MPTTDLWVLSCAPGSRTAEARDLFASTGVPASRQVLVTTLPDPVADDGDEHLILFPSEEINISKWWTLGLDYIANHYGPDERWDVLIAETDARMSTRDIDLVRTVMRTSNTVMAGADRYGLLGHSRDHIRRSNKAWIPSTIDRAPSITDSRIPGVMCVIAGETGLRHDPDFRWWLADDDFEWQHRVYGGSVLVGGTTVHHLGTQGELTGDRLTAWREDLPKFRSKWGGIPADGGIVS